MRLTQERLKAVLDYDSTNGLFNWRVSNNGRIRVGQRAGSLKPPLGYVQIKVDRVLYAAHRLAWLWVHGTFPENHIDHIDGDHANNRLANLRDVPVGINAQNLRRARSNNESTKLLGVSRRNKTRGGFQARIRFEGKEKRLGTFPTAEQAYAAYVAAKRELHPGCTI